MSRMPRSAPRFRSTTLFTGGTPSLAGPAIVNSFKVLRERPVKRQRAPGAGKRSHSGFVASKGAAAGGGVRVAFMVVRRLSERCADFLREFPLALTSGASTDLKASSSAGLKLTVLRVDFLPDSIRKIFFGVGWIFFPRELSWGGCGTDLWRRFWPLSLPGYAPDRPAQVPAL